MLLQSVDRYHAANPVLVGKALEASLRMAPNVLRVTRHHPEAFFVNFDFPKHREAASRLGSLVVERSTFLQRSWREMEHAVCQRWNFHARVCIEHMPLHLWNIEGTQEVLGSSVLVDRLDSRTYAQEDTAIFNCWVWCWELDHIPSTHPFVVFPEDAGRVKEMLGYLPPSR